MFRYRLQTLLNFRKSLEENAQRSLAHANRKLMEEKERVESFEQSREDTIAGKRKLYKETIRPSLLSLYDNFTSGKDIDIVEGMKQVEMTNEIVTMERERLVEAVKQKRILELHKDRQKVRYDENEAKQERNLADEMALSRYVARK